jgi:hypothetical protein
MCVLMINKEQEQAQRMQAAVENSRHIFIQQTGDAVALNHLDDLQQKNTAVPLIVGEI